MKTAFETLQSILTIEDTFEFREKHLPEILDAMEKYADQFRQPVVSDSVLPLTKELAEKIFEAGGDWRMDCKNLTDGKITKIQ